MTKITFRKFHISLGALLAAVFAAVILVEILALYRYLYLESQKEAPAAAQQVPVLHIDFGASEKAEAWFQEQENFVPTSYEFRNSPGAGRENPFSEY